ncbi:hypothetical protein MTR67_038225 [Solanum verrucosum]|uniref:Uncharacterized protein n=1 Tax=Solanum verrucosum TaxID=315347 RepID=A0AAF0ZPG4_SOLVR|nr:hypothetical protein MTR67_038225 [Solanum verrucosum]
MAQLVWKVVIHTDDPGSIPSQCLLSRACRIGLPSVVYIPCVVCRLLHNGGFTQCAQSAHLKGRGCSGCRFPLEAAVSAARVSRKFSEEVGYQQQSKGEFLYQQVNYGNVEGIKSLCSKLTQQLEILKRKTASSATDDLKVQLQKLKDKYNSDIQNLAVPAQDLHENSQLAFSKVNSEISKHSSAFTDLVGKISADVNAILNGLQGNIRELEVKINAFVRQEQQELAASEERQLIEKVAELILASSTKKKRLVCASSLQLVHTFYGIRGSLTPYFCKRLFPQLKLVTSRSHGSNFTSYAKVQTAVNDLRECSNIKTRNLNAEFSDIQGCANSAYEKWTNYIESTDAHHIEDSTRLEFWKSSLAGNFDCWSAMESNGKIGTQLLSSTVTSILEETAISKRNLLFVMESTDEASTPSSATTSE